MLKLSRFCLNAFLCVLEHFSWEEEDERQISPALYTRLEFSAFSLIPSLLDNTLTYNGMLLSERQSHLFLIILAFFYLNWWDELYILNTNRKSQKFI